MFSLEKQRRLLSFTSQDLTPLHSLVSTRRGVERRCFFFNRGPATVTPACAECACVPSSTEAPFAPEGKYASEMYEPVDTGTALAFFLMAVGVLGVAAWLAFFAGGDVTLHSITPHHTTLQPILQPALRTLHSRVYHTTLDYTRGVMSLLLTVCVAGILGCVEPELSL